jgi:hypothetical protein
MFSFELALTGGLGVVVVLYWIHVSQRLLVVISRRDSLENYF